MLSKQRIVSSIFVFAFCVNAAFTQGGGYALTGQLSDMGYTGVVYDATNGLPSSDANFLLGSKDGYVWVGSYNGILRYDGINFERLPASTGLTNCRAFFEDSQNRIWVGTNDNGVVVIDGEKTKHYTYKEGLPASSIRGFAEDNDGNIFIATTSGLAFVTKSGILYPIIHSTLDKEIILKLVSDSTGKIYGQSSNGIVFAIENKNVTELYTSNDLQMPRITTILADPFQDGTLYFCCEGGIIYRGTFGKTSSSMQKINVSPMHTIQWISYECDRIILCSTNQFGYLDQNNQLKLIENLPLNKSIEMFTSDYQGNIWVCSSTQGVMKVVTNNFINVTQEANLPKKPVNTTCVHN